MIYDGWDFFIQQREQNKDNNKNNKPTLNSEQLGFSRTLKRSLEFLFQKEETQNLTLRVSKSFLLKLIPTFFFLFVAWISGKLIRPWQSKAKKHSC